MKKALFLCFLPALVFAFGDAVVKFRKEPGKVQFLVQNGFGVQRDGKHTLTFTDALTGKVLKTVHSFQGSIAHEDKKYFNRLDAVELPRNSGSVRVKGRIFYCSFAQKYCSVQRIDQTL